MWKNALTSSLIHVWLPSLTFSLSLYLFQTSGCRVGAAAFKWVDTGAAGSAKSQQGQTPSPPQKQWSQSPGISIWAISSQRADTHANAHLLGLSTTNCWSVTALRKPNISPRAKTLRLWRSQMTFTMTLFRMIFEIISLPNPIFLRY